MDCGKPSSKNKQAKTNQCNTPLVYIITKDMRSKLTCTGQVFRYDIFGRKATADRNLVETLQGLLQYD